MSDAKPQATESNPDHYLISASGLLGDPPQSAVTEVARIVAKAAAAAPENGLVIHMHGGLVSRPYALKNIVAPLTDVYLSAKAYPLFFVWEAGFFETLENNKKELLNDPAFRELVKKVSEWALKKVSLSGVFSFKGTGNNEIEDIHEFRNEFDKFFDEKRETPPSETTNVPIGENTQTKTKAKALDEDSLAQEIQGTLDNDPDFKKALAEAYNASIPASELVTKGVGTKTKSSKLLLDPGVLDEMFPTEDEAPAAPGQQVKSRGVLSWLGVAKYVAKIVIAVVKRYVDGRDHGMYCTVVEEVLRSAYGNLIGAVIWNKMKDDTQDSFGEGNNRCGYAVISELKKLEQQGKGITRLTLVGHSTGAIYICNFLDEATRQGLDADIRVVFLAPAITCDRFADAITAHGVTKLKSFRMFAMTDERESADRMLNPLYTRSLLYFVSGLLEGHPSGSGWQSVLDMPVVGMQRFYESATFYQDSKVNTVSEFLKGAPNRTVWSRSAGQESGLNSDSQKHGDFDNDKTTLESVAAFIGR